MATILEKTAGLVAFVRTVDAGSFASAARLIGASPAAVSKSVARLEQRLGVSLLQRSTRTLGPTAEGAAYYERVAPHLRAIEEADDIVQVPENVRGVLRVTAPSTFGRPLIAAWAGSFLDRYPDIEARAERHGSPRGPDPRKLRHRGTNWRAADTQFDRPFAGCPALCLGRIAWVSRSMTHCPGRSMTLKQHACLRYLRAGRPFPFTFADASKRIVPEGPFVPRMASSVFGEAALEGAGITRFMLLAIQDDLADGRLRIVLPEIPMVSEAIHILHPFGRQLPLRVRLFIDFLVEAFAGLSGR